MEIIKQKTENTLTISLIGRLDSTTSPALESEIRSSLIGIGNLIFDFAQLEYLSSAGLRIILIAQKMMNKQGKMCITNVNEANIEIFHITGFIDIINIV